MKELLVQKMREDAIMPTRAYESDAGLDLYSPISISGADLLVIDVGIAISIPRGWVGIITSRSSQSMRDVLAHTGIIDSGYHASLKVMLRKLNSTGAFAQSTVSVMRGERIGQLLLLPIGLPELVLVDQLPESHRGTKGFGSTGK